MPKKKNTINLCGPIITMLVLILKLCIFWSYFGVVSI